MAESGYRDSRLYGFSVDLLRAGVGLAHCTCDRIHEDGSLWSFVLALNGGAAAFDGGGTRFEALRGG